MRKLIAISFIFLLLFPGIGYLFFFKMEQHYIRKSMFEQIRGGIPDELLEVIKIPAHPDKISSLDFEWEDKNEFRYNGTMYDVVKREVHGDSTWYYCLADEDETELIAFMKKWQQENDINSPEKQKKGQDHNSPLYFSTLPSFSFETENTTNPSLPYFLHPKSWDIEPGSPPPKG